MQTVNKPLSIKVIYWVTNITFWLYVAASILSLLKRIAYALVGIWGFIAFYAHFQYFFVVNNLEFSSLETTGEVQTYPVILLVALFIWVLSHIFMKGCELQEDNNYTI